MTLILLLLRLYISLLFQEFEGTKELVLSVEDEVGIRTIIDELLDALKNQNPGIRKVCYYNLFISYVLLNLKSFFVYWKKNLSTIF